MKTSPGFIVSAGNFSRKCRTVAGRQPMKPGRLMVDCASDRPSWLSLPVCKIPGILGPSSGRLKRLGPVEWF